MNLGQELTWLRTNHIRQVPRGLLLPFYGCVHCNKQSRNKPCFYAGDLPETNLFRQTAKNKTLTPVGKITPSPTSPSHPSRCSVFCFFHCPRFYTLLRWFANRLSPPHQNELEVRSVILSTIIWSVQRSEPCTQPALKYLSSHELGSHLSLAAPWPSTI